MKAWLLNVKSLVNYDGYSNIFLLTPKFKYGAAMLPANPTPYNENNKALCTQDILRKED